MSDYGKVTAVIVATKGSTLTTAAGFSDVALLVDSAQDFDSDGGTLDLNGTRMQYTSVVEGTNVSDPDTINLAEPLAEGADEDSNVAPIVGGAIPEDWYAVITMGEEGDSVHVPLELDQRDKWPVGEYTDPVPVIVSDDLQRLLDAPGRTVLPSTTVHELARFQGFNTAQPDAGPIDDGDTGQSSSFTWTQADGVGVGTVIVLEDGYSQITLTEPGVYSVAWSIYVADIKEAAASSSLALEAAPNWLFSSYWATVFGGNINQAEPVGSFTYYLSQKNIDDGDNTINFNLHWQNFDVDNMHGTYCDVMVQQLLSAATPTTSNPPEPVPTPVIVFAESFETGTLGDYLRESDCPGLTYVYEDGCGIFIADPHSGSQAAELNDGVGGPGLSSSTMELETPAGASEVGFYFKVSSAVTYFPGGRVQLNTGWRPVGGGVGSSETVQIDIDPYALTLHSTDTLGYDSTVSFALDTWHEVNIKDDGTWYVSDGSTVLDISGLNPLPDDRVLWVGAAGITGSGHGTAVDDFYYRPAPDVQ